MKLTSKQEERLIRICRILYPGRNTFISYSDIEPIEVEQGTLHYPEAFRFVWIIDTKKDEFVVYPWFEFCCNDLLGELASCQFNGIADDVIWDQTLMDYWKAVSLDNIHPVDWLYNFYQSIPKGQ